MFLGILCAWATTNLSWSYDKCCATLWSLKIDVVRMLNGQLSFINEFVLTTSYPKLIRKQYLCLLFHVLVIVRLGPARMVV